MINRAIKLKSEKKPGTYRQLNHAKILRKDLELLLKSSHPIIIIETLEESRLMGMFDHIIDRINRPFFRWTVTEGLKRLDVDMPAQLHNSKPLELLTQIKLTSQQGVYLLLDFHPFPCPHFSWYLVSGIWYLVSGIWYLVSGIWYLVSGN